MWRTWNNKKILTYYSQSGEINISASVAETFSGKVFEVLREFSHSNQREQEKEVVKRHSDVKQNTFPPCLHWGFVFSVVASIALACALLTYMVKLEMKAAAGICISNTASRASEPLFTMVQDTVVKAYREMIVDLTWNSDIRGLVSYGNQKVTSKQTAE